MRPSLLMSLLIAGAVTAGTLWVERADAAGETGELRAKEAAVALQRGQAERATQLYTEALADTGLPNSRRSAILNDRGVAFSRINQPRVAIDDFNRAVQLSPESASIYNNRGNVLLAIGLASEAVKDFDRALLLAPGYAAAYSNRANAHGRLGDNEAAIRDFSHAVRLAPQSAAAYTGRGRLHLAQNRPHAALRDFSRAVGHDARFGPGYRARAAAKLAIARYEEAIEDLSRAVAFEPTNLEIYILRGYAYLAARNTGSAIKDFARAAEIDTRSNAAHEGLALANAKAEAFDDALNDIAKALELEPRSAQAYAYRAIIYKLMGQPELGSKDVERAVKLEPGRPEVLWARGELAEVGGQTAEAVADLAKAVAGRPLLRDAAVALDRLGAAAPDEVEAKELAFDRWRVFVQAGRYYASNADFPKLAVPLEAMSALPPRILEWDTRKVPAKGYGLLRFTAGQIEGKEGPEEVEHAAVVDLAARTVVAVETVRQGKRTATWTWDDTKLVVASVDGFTEDYPLKARAREAAQQPVAAAPQSAQPRRVTSSQGQGGTPSWAPWAQPNGGEYRGGGGRQRQQQPKTLFELLFKN